MSLGLVRSIPLLCAASALAACLSSRPLLMEGDASFARVQHSNDVAAATAVAARHCAGYERVASLRAADAESAVFDCRRR